MVAHAKVIIKLYTVCKAPDMGCLINIVMVWVIQKQITCHRVKIIFVPENAVFVLIIQLMALFQKCFDFLLPDLQISAVIPKQFLKHLSDLFHFAPFVCKANQAAKWLRVAVNKVFCFLPDLL